jgi:hypothetical protein
LFVHITIRPPNRIESNLGDRPPPCTCSGCTDPNHALSFPSFVALHLHRTVSRIPKGQAAAGQACILSRACRHTASHTGTERYALVPSPSLPGRPDAASSSYTFIVACLLCPRGLGSCIAHLPGRAGEVVRFISIRKAGEATVGVLGGHLDDACVCRLRSGTARCLPCAGHAYACGARTAAALVKLTHVALHCSRMHVRCRPEEASFLLRLQCWVPALESPSVTQRHVHATEPSLPCHVVVWTLGSRLVQCHVRRQQPPVRAVLPVLGGTRTVLLRATNKRPRRARLSPCTARTRIVHACIADLVAVALAALFFSRRAGIGNVVVWSRSEPEGGRQ